MSLELDIRIDKITKRYWFWHPIYKEAQRGGYRIYKWWKPYVDVVLDFRYFVSGREFDLMRSRFK